MGSKSIFLTVAIMLGAVVAFSGPSWAYCGVLQYSSGGATQKDFCPEVWILGCGDKP